MDRVASVVPYGISTLIIDADRVCSARTAQVLQGLSCGPVQVAESLVQARQVMDVVRYDLIITELRLPDGPTFDLIAGMASARLGRVMVYTSVPTGLFNLARMPVSALLHKPATVEQLCLHVGLAWEQAGILTVPRLCAPSSGAPMPAMFPVPTAWPSEDPVLVH